MKCQIFLEMQLNLERSKGGLFGDLLHGDDHSHRFEELELVIEMLLFR